MAEKVELQPAFAWTCPFCGTRVFVEAVRAELTDQERAAMREDLGTDQGDWLQQPDEVECFNCRRRYETDQSETEPGDFDPHKVFGGDPL